MNFFEVEEDEAGYWPRKPVLFIYIRITRCFGTYSFQTLREMIDLTWIWTHTWTTSHHRRGVVYHEVDWHRSDHRVRGRNRVKSKWQPTQKETGSPTNLVDTCFLTRLQSLEARISQRFPFYNKTYSENHLEDRNIWGGAWGWAGVRGGRRNRSSFEKKWGAKWWLKLSDWSGLQKAQRWDDRLSMTIPIEGWDRGLGTTDSGVSGGLCGSKINGVLRDRWSVERIGRFSDVPSSQILMSTLVPF